MNNLILFIYESGICIAALFGFYWFFLRKETYFKFNRLYLLSILLFSCLIPLVSFGPFEFETEASALGIITGMGEGAIFPGVKTADYSIAALNPSINWQHIIVVIYLLGVVAIVTRIILGIFRVAKLRRGGKRINFEGYSVVYSKQNLAPFSFFRTVFINESLLDSSQESYVINHEVTHIRQLHTYDNIFVEVFLALFWFNPFIWLIRSSLRHTHEYLADDGVKKADSNLRDYQTILLQQINGTSPLCVSNDFNSMIKSRIKIMCRSKSAFLAKLKPLFIVPVALCLALIFACSNMEDLLPMDNLKSRQSERVTEIMDLRNLPDSVITFFSGQPQDYEVRAARITQDDGSETYLVHCVLEKYDTINFGLTHWGTSEYEDFDKLYYHWQGDTAIVKFENSVSKEHMVYRWYSNDSIMTFGRYDIP
jgi:hypothetical protein